jgi:SAM-dependent methyltransferase
MPPIDQEALKAKYNLTYHVPFALEGQSRIDFRGKDVLEVGGSLPRGFVLDELGAKSWIGIEEFDYYTEIHKPSAIQPTCRLEEVTSVDALGDYAILSGRIEKLTPIFFTRFDAIFSIAAFEHIDHMAAALDRMYDALRPGGMLFTMFSPIWSSHDGHHLHRVVDAKGTVFDYSNCPIPAWGHLFLTPPQMFIYLLDHTDRDAAAEIVYQVYNSTGINRLFTEDYFAYFQESRFTIKTLEMIFPTQILEGLKPVLEAKNPPYKHFENNGLLVVLEKPS